MKINFNLSLPLLRPPLRGAGLTPGLSPEVNLGVVKIALSQVVNFGLSHRHVEEPGSCFPFGFPLSPVCTLSSRDVLKFCLLLTIFAITSILGMDCSPSSTVSESSGRAMDIRCSKTDRKPIDQNTMNSHLSSPSSHPGTGSHHFQKQEENCSQDFAACPQACQLAERVKELNCLYGISNLFENQDVSLEWIMQRAVELIPAAWQYPENACALIRIEGQEYTSQNFQVTKCSQKADIALNGEEVGVVEVMYRHCPAQNAHKPFLQEEERLLRAIAQRLSKILWLKRAEQALRESEELYRTLTEQVTEGVALIQNCRFSYLNPEFCHIFQVDYPESLIGSRIDVPVPGAEKELIGIYKDIGPAWPKKQQEDVFQLHRKGKTVWIQICHSPITLQGQPALLSTFKDITELKEQQLAAQSQAAQLHKENRALWSSLGDRYKLGQLIGRSRAMQDVYAFITKAAATEANVAIQGESGTGKELVARAIHEHSSRSEGPFVAVNCGAIQESLFEREFFGHRKGAFTGAHANSPGYLDLAAGGTLFLDEITELTTNMQAKLLRAIEGGDYRPVGGSGSLSADLRIISASNIDLNTKVSQGGMRPDFYYRIQVIYIQVPPLRSRKEDIPLLVDHFWDQMEQRTGRGKIPGHIIDRLIEYDWPGNVRELRNVLQRYTALGHLEFLAPESQGPRLMSAQGSLNLRQAVEQLETSLISRALAEANGNRTLAAEMLGISRRALFRRLNSSAS